MASPRSLHTKIAALLVVATVSIGVLVPQTDAFVSGGPGRSSKAPKPSRQEGKTQLEEVDSRPALEAADDPSPFSCEVVYVGDSVARGKSLGGVCFDSDLTPAQARAITLEAAASKTVPKATVLEALGCLTLASAADTQGGAATAPAEALDGVWRLCFCDGEPLGGVEVDRHGYVSREQQVDVRFDSKDKRIVLGNRGIQSSLPKVVHGGLSYAQETQKVIATFEKESVGIESLVLHACLVDEDSLAFRTVSQGKNGFLLFHAEKSKAAADRLSKDAVTMPSAVSEAQKAATASVAGKKKLELKVDLKLVSEEEVHEDRRLAVEETGRKTGSFGTFMRYLETEGPTLYAVFAGPVLFSFMRNYSYTASDKATAAFTVLGETFRHMLDVNT